MKNIAITGRMAAGKTTLSQTLVDMYGFRRCSFAARLKELAATVYAPAGQTIAKDGLYTVTRPEGMEVRISGRQLLQELGQVVKGMDRDLWIRWLAKDARTMGGPLVLDDMRFKFEADFLRSQGWLIAKVEVPEEVRMARYETLYGRRPTHAELSHPSETGVDGIEADLVLDGTEAVAGSVARLLHAARTLERAVA